jgi:Fe-S-cluster-containing dehydrogenase component/DMSO reductase anchor subunit
MTEGFIFDHNKCVACGACSASCMLENQWSFSPRVIFAFNSIALPSLPIINLSLACNHCQNAVCMDGCPSSAYYKEPATGAIIVDDSKCIGCRYCQWNCPYDAPKYLISQKVIGKCNLCSQRLIEGLLPACSTSCPTGALEYGQLNDQSADKMIPWVPEKTLRPSVELTGRINQPPDLIPQKIFDIEKKANRQQDPAIQLEWSLIAFSFLTTLSVAKVISGLIDGIFPQKLFFILIIGVAALLSVFHLGKKRRAWRAILNLRHSPLSREIGLFLLYFLFAALTVIIHLPFLLIISAITGLMLLVTIDMVYIYADNRKTVFLHSGQTFFTVLLLIAFLTGKILPFIFIAVLKLTIAVYYLRTKRDVSIIFVLRFVRTALLIITGISMISAISYPGTAIITLFLAGELLDRILFYIDFKPLNINRLMNYHLNEAEYEEERG